MKEKEMIELADKLKISRTTVRKAINHCPGIHPCTKNKILSSITDFYYKPIIKENKIAVILPSIPSFFWKTMRENIHKEAISRQLNCSFFVYTNLSDSADALNCIQTAINLNASVIIAAVPDEKKIKTELEKKSLDKLVILIEEFSEIKNTFYIGENSFQEGYLLGKEYINKYPLAQSFTILRLKISTTAKLRIDGFKKALAENNKQIFKEIKCEAERKIQSAQIARALYELYDLPDCIFCPSGTVSTCCSAIRKLKTEKEIHCIGFDTEENEKEKEILKLASLQNINDEITTALNYADNYIKHQEFPVNKNSYIQNFVLRL